LGISSFRVVDVFNMQRRLPWVVANLKKFPEIFLAGGAAAAPPTQPTGSSEDRRDLGRQLLELLTRSTTVIRATLEIDGRPVDGRVARQVRDGLDVYTFVPRGGGQRRELTKEVIENSTLNVESRAVPAAPKPPPKTAPHAKKKRGR
jgi:hypothetical protein